MPRTPIDQFDVNTQVRKQRFVLRERNMSVTRGGRTLLHVTLGDRTGSIPGVLFDAPSYLVNTLKAGEGVEVTGAVEDFHGGLQIRIDTISPATLTDLADYVPTSERPITEMARELSALVDGVTHPDLHRLLQTIFSDRALYDAFLQAPAARQMHHAYLGGLLEHTLSVVQAALSGCQIHPEADRDLVVTVAILHDLGKVRTYDPITFALTDEGALWSHLYMSASIVEKAIDALEGFDPSMRLRVVHGILAHHGRREHGSPVVPMTIEAMIVHYADSMDAHVRGAVDAMARPDAEGGAYTGFSAMHDTRLYRGTSDLSD